MHRTRIKFCGITSAVDALAAADAGADAIGMIFHPPATRKISEETARQILGVLPPFVTPVGLFVDAEANDILEIATRLSLRNIQLHGDEDAEAVAQLAPLSLFKAVRVERGKFDETLATWRRAIESKKLIHLRGLLLETAHTAERGGTGAPNDWETVADTVSRNGFVGLPPIIAAGGLTPETVGDVVRRIRPWAVDVSSGIEAVRGKKSVEKMRAFVAAVRQADEDISRNPTSAK